MLDCELFEHPPPRHKLHLDPVRVLHEQRAIIRASGREGLALVREHGDFLLPAPGPQGIDGRAALHPEGEVVQPHAAAVTGAGPRGAAGPARR